MKTKDVLTKRFGFRPNELDSVAEFLEEKAAEGWELNSKVGEMFSFRKCEPRKVKISVEFVTDDQVQNKEQFVEYCESEGWKHIFSDGSYLFFENEDLEAEAIHTDTQVKLDMIHKKYKKDYMSLLITLGCWACLWFFSIKEFSVLMLANWIGIVQLIGIPIVSILIILIGADYMYWYKGAKRKIEKGEDPIYKRSRLSIVAEKLSWGFLTIGVFGSLYFDVIYAGKIRTIFICTLGIIAVVGFVEIYPRIVARRNPEKEASTPVFAQYCLAVGLVICFFGSVYVGNSEKIVYHPDGGTVHIHEDNIPLTLDDLGIESTGYRDTWRDKAGTVLLTYFKGDDSSYNADDNHLFYEIYKTKYKAIYNKVLGEECWNFPEEFHLVNEPIFKAKEVYADDYNNWIILYEDMILDLRTDIELSDEQKKIIVEKLI